MNRNLTARVERRLVLPDTRAAEQTLCWHLILRQIKLPFTHTHYLGLDNSQLTTCIYKYFQSFRYFPLVTANLEMQFCYTDPCYIDRGENGINWWLRELSSKYIYNLQDDSVSSPRLIIEIAIKIFFCSWCSKYCPFSWILLQLKYLINVFLLCLIPRHPPPAVPGFLLWMPWPPPVSQQR